MALQQSKSSFRIGLKKTTPKLLFTFYSPNLSLRKTIFSSKTNATPNKGTAMGIRMAPSYANLYISRLIWIIYWNTTHSSSFSYFYSYFGTLCFIQSSPASDHPWFSGVDLISKYELIMLIKFTQTYGNIIIRFLDIRDNYQVLVHSEFQFIQKCTIWRNKLNFHKENTVLLISGRAYTVAF